MTQQARVALITGGIGGIGTAICRRLATDGYRVVANHHPAEQEAADAWRRERAEEGQEIDTVAGDVASFEDASRMVQEVKDRYGAVDVLVNCAGITRDKTFKKMEHGHWVAVIDVNLNSVFNATRPVWEDMLERGFGRVINISSVNGQRGQFGQANYSAAKAGMHGLTMALAQAGAARGHYRGYPYASHGQPGRDRLRRRLPGRGRKRLRDRCKHSGQRRAVHALTVMAPAPPRG